MNSFTPDGTPELFDRLHGWVEAHRGLEDETLRLALAFDPGRDSQDVFLFEVSDNFGSNSVSEDRAMLEASYLRPQDFPLRPGQNIRLILTNPPELRAALAEGWPAATEIRQAIRRGDFEILYQDSIGEGILREIKGE